MHQLLTDVFDNNKSFAHHSKNDSKNPIFNNLAIPNMYSCGLKPPNLTSSKYNKSNYNQDDISIDNNLVDKLIDLASTSSPTSKKTRKKSTKSNNSAKSAKSNKSNNSAKSNKSNTSAKSNKRLKKNTTKKQRGSRPL